jgi:hypothetical protein
MAIQQLDLKLDQMNETLVDQDQREKLASAPMSETATADAMAPMQAEMQEEGIQVAGGGGSVMREVLKKLKPVEIRKPPVAPLTPEAATAAAVEDTTKAAINAGVTTSKTEAKIAAKVQANAKPAITPEAFASQRAEVQKIRAVTDPATEVPPATVFNLPKMETTEDIKSTIETMNKMAGIKTQTITFDDVRTAAEGAGIGPKFIDDITSGKLEVSPENTYKALNAMVASAKHLDGLAAKVADGSATPTELAEMAQTIHFHNLLQQSVKGYQTNVAQSLAVMRMPRDGAVDISSIIENFGNETDIVKFAQAYLDVKTPEGKANMIKSMAQGNPWEKMYTVYVNGILSRPGTHLKNALSNTVFLPWRMTERAVAATIGTVRQGIGLGGDDAYSLLEVPTMLASTTTAVRNGWELMSHAFVNGVPKGWNDPTKIARQQSRLELFNAKADGSLLSAGIRSLNYVTTLPGRALMTSDEFFKGVNYTYELSAEASRLGINTYNDALKSGSSVADALKAKSDAIDRFLLEPPDYIVGLAETGTFTQRLEGTAGKIQSALTPNTATGFALRTQLPFIATPVNVMGEAVARTPLAPFTSSFWSAMKQGGKEADMAMTKVGLGGAAIYGFSQMATNGTITGSGPGDKGTRQAMERQGWQPYSFVFDISNLTEDVRQDFSQFPGMVRFGSGDYAGKVYLSYQGMEPIGALMGMSADYVDYARYEEDDSRVNALAGGIVFGVANYMLEHPMLTGVSNITSLLGGSVPNSRQHMVEMLNGIARIGTTTAIKSVEPLSGIITSTKEKIDPLRRDYQADPNLPAGLKGLMDAVNKWKSETPGLSENLPPMLNIWGETVPHEYTWSPLRMKEGKMSETDQALIQLNANISMPTRQVNMVDPKTGISSSTKLTSEEYNEVIRIANDKLKLEDQVKAVVQMIKEDDNKQPLIRYQNMISKTFSDVFEISKKFLLEESIYGDDIKERIADKAERLNEFGKGAK